MEIHLLEHLLNTSTTLPLTIANQGGPPAIPLLAVLCLPFGACLTSSNPSQLPAPGLTHGNASLWSLSLNYMPCSWGVSWKW